MAQRHSWCWWLLYGAVSMAPVSAPILASNNTLHHTTKPPSHCHTRRLTVSLQTITLHNTSMTGALPGVTRAAYMAHGFDTTQLCRGDGAGLGRLPSLQLATISDTAMTALCDKVNGDCDDISAYLPWWVPAGWVSAASSCFLSLVLAWLLGESQRGVCCARYCWHGNFLAPMLSAPPVSTAE
jgi:hypothetical protein